MGQSKTLDGRKPDRSGLLAKWVCRCYAFERLCKAHRTGTSRLLIMSQLNLFALSEGQIKFEKYHRENPEIWEAFKELTFQLIKAGRKHYSADGILHAIRFNTALRGGLDYKINNNFSSYYSRLFTGNFPEHKDFFEQRKLKEK